MVAPHSCSPPPFNTQRYCQKPETQRIAALRLAHYAFSWIRTHSNPLLLSLGSQKNLVFPHMTTPACVTCLGGHESVVSTSLISRDIALTEDTTRMRATMTEVILNCILSVLLEMIGSCWLLAITLGIKWGGWTWMRRNHIGVFLWKIDKRIVGYVSGHLIVPVKYQSYATLDVLKCWAYVEDPPPSVWRQNEMLRICQGYVLLSEWLLEKTAPDETVLGRAMWDSRAKGQYYR